MKIETMLEMPDAALNPIGTVREAVGNERRARVTAAVTREMTLQMWQEIIDLHEDRAAYAREATGA